MHAPIRLSVWRTTMLGYRVSAFQLCGYTGFFLAFVLSAVLVRQLGLSELTLLGITGCVILTFYIIVYGCGRFCLEFFRGDATRPYLYGFSEAQWTSLLLAMAALLAEHVTV